MMDDFGAAFGIPMDLMPVAFRVLKRPCEGYHLCEQVCAVNDCVCKEYDAMHSDVVNGDHIHCALRLAGGAVAGGVIHPSSMWYTMTEAKTIPSLRGVKWGGGDLYMRERAEMRGCVMHGRDPAWEEGLLHCPSCATTCRCGSAGKSERTRGSARTRAGRVWKVLLGARG